jgi:hypothetical protein
LAIRAEGLNAFSKGSGIKCTEATCCAFLAFVSAGAVSAQDVGSIDTPSPLASTSLPALSMRGRARISNVGSASKDQLCRDKVGEDQRRYSQRGRCPGR